MRSIVVNKTTNLDRKRPEKSLTVPLKSKTGRSHGRVSVRSRGGGHKRLYRLIDFKRYDKSGVGIVSALEYDPNRSAHIALITYNDGAKRYIIAPQGLKVGDQVESGPNVKIKPGNALPLGMVPVGTSIHNVEMRPGQGGKIVRGAGQLAKVMAKEEGRVHVKLPSGEVRLFLAECYATVGQVGNIEHSQIVLGKAGGSRHRGIRPSVRGTAMPAGEHPHGGGEGRTGTGRIPKTPWGKLAHGVRTRKPKKLSNKYIVKTRRQK